MPDPVTLAILAKAPVAGLAKTRLIPALGAEGAATLQAQLIERAVTTACGAGVGAVTLWATPDDSHVSFQAMQRRFGVSLMRQPDGDLGARMHTAVRGPTLIIGTDCPALTANHLRRAADELQRHDVVINPATDGGYVLIGLRRPQHALFTDMRWSTSLVLIDTRRRIAELRISYRELDWLWDVDTPHDLERLRREISL